MITDQETDFLYLSPLLKKWYPEFFKSFQSKLLDYEIRFDFLDHSKDIWCRDYMPIQLKRSKFARFLFEPKYLKGKEKYKSDSIEITHSMSWKEMNIGAVSLDGGNVVKSKDKAISTSRIFEDNPNFNQDQIRNEIEKNLEIEHLIIIPEQPEDFTGHCDGMVRFVDDETVLINDNTEEEDQEFVESFETILKEEGLNTIVIPTSMYQNENAKDATGCYLNYLQIGDIILLPFFNRDEDEVVREQFDGVFSNHEIVPVFSNDVAVEGGVLNCIGWNIMI